MAEWSVEVTVDAGEVPDTLVQELEGVVRRTLEAEAAGDAEISLTLVSDDKISELNQRYLSHEGPTDVLSFPMEQPGGTLVGDIYLGIEQGARQAAELDVPLREELLRLAIHGTLHVLGWEHPEEGDRPGSEMYRRQEEILASHLSQS
jgi:probable rRNA maturation factor